MNTLTGARNAAGRFITKRSTGIDKLRGLAIILMILDHVVFVTNGPFVIRETITRAAMPIFFLVSGHLVKQVSFRLVTIGTIGIALPTVVTFLDNPNVLVWYALFAPVIVVLKLRPNYLPVALGIILSLAANNHIGIVANSYPPMFLLALMILGAIIPRKRFVTFERLPNVFTFIGKFPLTIYVVSGGILQVLFR